MSKTDHSSGIASLRNIASLTDEGLLSSVLLTASDLLEMHDRQSLSLDNWDAARNMVEALTCTPITKNGV